MLKLSFGRGISSVCVRIAEMSNTEEEWKCRRTHAGMCGGGHSMLLRGAASTTGFFPIRVLHQRQRCPPQCYRSLPSDLTLTASTGGKCDNCGAHKWFIATTLRHIECRHLKTRSDVGAEAAATDGADGGKSYASTYSLWLVWCCCLFLSSFAGGSSQTCRLRKSSLHEGELLVGWSRGVERKGEGGSKWGGDRGETRPLFR